MTKVRIEMDETWRWWPVSEQEDAHVAALTDRQTTPCTFEIDNDLYVRWVKLHREYQDLQEQFEQLYRIERGLAPWPETPIPTHTKL